VRGRVYDIDADLVGLVKPIVAEKAARADGVLR
jgi:hypothetical protein